MTERLPVQVVLRDFPVRLWVRQQASQQRELAQQLDEYCRRGDLLTLAMPADLVALRDWTTGEILRQCAGEPPTPWPGTSG